MSATAIGTPVKRKEDASLLRGQGTYVENLTLPGTVFMAVVRSPYPHARITRVSLDRAKAAQGVVAAFSGADLADDWKGSLPCAWVVTEDTKTPPHYPLATDEARYQGDGVAVVLAESRALAKDAAELVEVEYEQLRSVGDVEKALEDGAPLVHGDLGTNECYVWKLESEGVSTRRSPPQTSWSRAATGSRDSSPTRSSPAVCSRRSGRPTR
jgi:carbon-monoxide dehydrogenase large subunit